MTATKLTPLVLFLLFLSMISGFLMSKASFVGRIGISLFYKEYKFLKTWWQGAAVVFFVLLIVLIAQFVLHKKLSASKARIASILFTIAAFVGFYFTWQDFHQTRTHRMLGDRFHLGGYLFWVGWLVVCGYFFFQKPVPVIQPEP